ncbi:hypothetical protein V5799_000478 [Amblyomma americanum]|uniref:Uncharacterized protein n=1 Tax=Amblyomma americanum TaxID=6943 RepID=A0AAQ4D2Z1_AMBAM
MKEKKKMSKRKNKSLNQESSADGSWELSAIFELELLPTPKAAGGRPRWRLSPSGQLSSWRDERKRLGPEYLTRIRRHVEAFSSTEVTRSLVDSVFEADDEVLRVTNTQLWMHAMNEVTRGFFKVHGSDVIAVSNARFLVALQRLLGEMNARKPHVVPLYLSWHVLRTLAWTVAPDAQELQLDSEPERQDRCFRTVHDLMPLAAGKPYADSANWDVGTIEELFEAAKGEYVNRIMRCPWMDEASRHSAQDKIRSVRGVFPAPGLVWNVSALQHVYDCMPQDREAFFLPSVLEAKRCKHKLILSTAATGGTSSDTITWTSPAVYLVRYLDAYNSAVVMGSVLRPPVFQATGAHREVFNYAGLTFLFARLLFGAIDQKGSLRDDTGSLRPWWSNFTQDAFATAVRCLEDLYQFDAWFIGDEISDAVATAVSFAAYERHLEEFSANNREGLWAWLVWTMSWPRLLTRRGQSEFTDDQAFFMNRCFCFCSRKLSSLYSAGWTSPEEKCNLPLRNSPDFWRAFGCRRGDAMRAEKSCQLI